MAQAVADLRDRGDGPGRGVANPELVGHAVEQRLGEGDAGDGKAAGRRKERDGRAAKACPYRQGALALRGAGCGRTWQWPAWRGEGLHGGGEGRHRFAGGGVGRQVRPPSRRIEPRMHLGQEAEGASDRDVGMAGCRAEPEWRAAASARCLERRRVASIWTEQRAAQTSETVSCMSRS